MTLLQDPWLVAAVIGVVCLIIDVLLRAEKDEVVREFLGGIPLIYIPVVCALLTEGRASREYVVLGVVLLLIQFLVLQAFHRYGVERRHVGTGLAVISTAVFLGLWLGKPGEPHISIVSPKKMVQAPQGWASVVVAVRPTLGSDENVQVFVRSGDEKWWPCEAPRPAEESQFVSRCPFGNGDARAGDRFRIGALYGKRAIMQWLGDPAWEALRPASDVEEITFR